jgi:UDP-glucose 4-epimerase
VLGVGAGQADVTVWVTGCAGFVGTRLATALRTLGHRVIGLSRRAAEAADVSVRVDLSSADAGAALAQLVAGAGTPDVIVHAAARRPGPYTLSEYLDSNTAVTARLLESPHLGSPQQLIYLSTLSVYGRPEELPVRETHRTNGTSPYALTKRWGEQIVEAFQNRAPVRVLRLPSLYGAGQSDSLIDGLARRVAAQEQIVLFGRGEAVRDAIHVDDVVQAVVSCITHPPSSLFTCMNLGCGEPVTLRQFAEMLVDALASRSAIVLSDDPPTQPFDLYADVAEARRLIDFRPTPVRESIARYVDELRA